MRSKLTGVGIPMLEIQRKDGTWVPFFPILQLDLKEGDVVNTKRLSELPGTSVYGKYEGGCSAVWIYDIVEKTKLRDKHMKL
jgi:hypothetical protein